MAKELTVVAIEKAVPGPSRREIPDGKVTGLFLIVQPSGSRSWALRYRTPAGKPAKHTLGAYPALDLGAARKLAQQAQGVVASGGDPAAQKRDAKAAARAAKDEASDRIEDVVVEFVERYAKRNTRETSWRETERILKREIVEGGRPSLSGAPFGGWRGRRLSQIGRKDVNALLDRIVDDGAPVAANRTLAAFRRLCNWAIERGIITASPCDKIKAPAGETSRDRVLTDHEIRAAWRAFERVGWPFGKIAQLLLLTGARLREVAEMTWPEVDLAAKTWTIAKERAKNGVAHEIPLSTPALEILAALPHVGAKAGFVFTTNGRAPVSGFSNAKEQFDRAILQIERDALEDWTIHDLRRTAASGMASLGFPPHVVEALLNHKSGQIKGVAAVYNRYSYAAEKRAALEAWARKVDAVVSGRAPSNVVEMATARPIS